jgi:predicted regulator of Ras-like GTPase activity (Roadblock/LC7/MglB family)
MEISEKKISNELHSGQNRTARNQTVDDILRDLTGLNGVTAAAIVDKDGLVTSIRREFDVNTDSLGVTIQIVYGAATRAAEHSRQGLVKIVISENTNGYIMMAPLINGLMLAVLTDEDALLGAVRYEIKETLPTLNQLFHKLDNRAIP